MNFAANELIVKWYTSVLLMIDLFDPVDEKVVCIFNENSLTNN